MTLTPETLDDLSTACTEARREMRKKLLSIGDRELFDLYYRALMLSTHEARRFGRTEVAARSGLSSRAEA